MDALTGFIFMGLPIISIIIVFIIKSDKSRIQELEAKLEELSHLGDNANEANNYLLQLEGQKNKVAIEAKRLENKSEEQKQVIRDLEDKEWKIKQSISALNTEVSKVETQKSSKERELLNAIQKLENKIKEKENEITNLENVHYIQSFNIYKPRYDFPESSHYARKLNEIREEQTALLKNKQAAICHKEWAIEGNKQKGQKMINDIIRLMLIAFDGECDAVISKVKYSNIDQMEKKISKMYETINQMMVGFNCEITKPYFNLRIQELFLVHEYQEKKQEEKEEQQRIKDQIREEAALEREIERQLKESERDEEKFEKLLEKARRDMETAVAEKAALMQLKIEELEQQLQEAHERAQKALSMAQQTKAGHVYIISNIGSFGPDVVKIGMTRRLDPMDRVKELGDASVPFSFDVHAMIYTSDAPALENALHKAFAAYRVNRVNMRKEYFRVSLEDVERYVGQHMPDAEFTRFAEAGEYRRSLSYTNK